MMKADKEKEARARERAFGAIPAWSRWIKIPEHGSVSFAADGTAFVEATIRSARR